MINRGVSLVATLGATISCVALLYAGGQVNRSSANPNKRSHAPDGSHGEQPAGLIILQSFSFRTSQANNQPGSKIAFASDRDGNLEIYTMDTDGGGQTRLTENLAEDHSPTWSPDGSKLAFVSTRDGNAEIYVMNMNGTGQVRLTNNTAADLGPKWSPDGSQIGFFSNRDGNDEIYSMNPDGSAQVNLTKHASDDASFSYSPDGTMIAFSSARDDSQFDIYTMTLAGANVNRLTTAAGDDRDPSWSAQRVTFLSNRDDSDELYSMDAGGQNQVRLTNNANLDLDPSQPADGSKIAFASDRDGNLEIYLMNSDGTGLARLTTNGASDLQPALQPQAVISPPPAGASVIQFSAANYFVNESGPFATLTVTRTGDTSATSSVSFGTVNGNATNRSDYADHFGTLVFNPGEASKSFIILITDDVFIETNETLTATLSEPAGSVLGALNTATITIEDNDAVQPEQNPIDNARFFVSQHYADFLNRSPEPAGLDGWINIINQCGNNLACLHEMRISVSSGFFRSLEFQERGYFVYRFYSVSFSRPPTYAEFIPDMSGVSGFLTNEQLEAAKVAFINDFMTRPAFVSKYGGLGNAEFVDTLLTTAGVSLPNRQSLIDALNAGTKTRAQVLREIVESAEVYTRYYNEAFVVMSYFGYLRRDPDILYLDWIQILNSTGDFRIMVNGFVNSLEYRSRFGP